MSGLMHGGRLRLASEKYKIPFSDWLDLSTGVSPWTYPFNDSETSHWNRLPEDDDGLEAAAQEYYKSDSLLPVAGSQMAIQLIPKIWLDHLKSRGLLPESSLQLKVGLPRQGYKEHEKAWKKAGWQVVHYEGKPTQSMVAKLRALVVINPNNPSGSLINRDELLTWHRTLSDNNGLLVVDEAFADIDNSHSLSTISPQANLVVLRSIGKFFGLAGIRVGFVLANRDITTQLAAEIGPWVIAGPSREVTKQALQDSGWYRFQCARLKKSSDKLNLLLNTIATTYLGNGQSEAQSGASWRITGTGLFQTLYLPNAKAVHDELCKQAIFVRLTDEEDALRFGLPMNDSQWAKLETVLTQILR